LSTRAAKPEPDGEWDKPGGHVPLEDELEPKLDEMRARATDMYAVYLADKSLRFDAGGAVVWDEHGALPVGVAPPDVEYENQKWRTFLDGVVGLQDRFRSFYGLDPFDYTTIVGALGARAGSIAAESEESTDIYGRLDHADEHWVSRVDGMINEGQWSSDAATIFHEQFLFKFHDAVEQQQAYLRELGIAVQSYHDAVASGLDDLIQIADACIAHLSGHRDRPGDHSGFYTVVGIITGVLAFYPPLAVPLGLVSLGVGIASALEGEAANENPNAPSVQVGGPNEHAIILSTWDAIGTLEALLADVDESLWRGLSADLASPRGFASPGLDLGRPDLADGEGDFGQLEIVAADGVSLEDNDVVASIVDLYRAGYVHLRAAADQYDQALRRLDACVLPGVTSRFFPRSVRTFDEARSVLRRILENTRDSLADAGARLVEIATTYDLTDDENAEAIRQMGQIPPPVSAAAPEPPAPTPGGNQ
jgi:hypothetical protein